MGTADRSAPEIAWPPSLVGKSGRDWSGYNACYCLRAKTVRATIVSEGSNPWGKDFFRRERPTHSSRRARLKIDAASVAPTFYLRPRRYDHWAEMPCHGGKHIHAHRASGASDRRRDGKRALWGLRDRGRAVCSDSRVRPECPELVESQTRLSGQVPPQKNKRESAETRSPTTYSFARDRRCSHLP